MGRIFIQMYIWKWMCTAVTGWKGEQIRKPCSKSRLQWILHNIHIKSKTIAGTFTSFIPLLQCTDVQSMSYACASNAVIKALLRASTSFFSFSTCSCNSASLLPSVGSSLHLCRNSTISCSPSCNTQRRLHIYSDILCTEILFPGWFLISHWYHRFQPTGQEHSAVFTLAASPLKPNK